MFTIKKGPLKIWDITDEKGLIVHILYYQNNHALTYYEGCIFDLVISNELCYSGAKINKCTCLVNDIGIEFLDRDNTYVNNLQVDNLIDFKKSYDNILEDCTTIRVVDSLMNQVDFLLLVDLGIISQSGGIINTENVSIIEKELILYRSPGIISKWLFKFVSISGNNLNESLCVSIMETDIIYILPDPLLDSLIGYGSLEKMGTKHIFYIPEDKFEYDTNYKLKLLGRLCDESIVSGIRMKEKIQSHKHELVGTEKYVNQIVDEINKFQIEINKIKSIFKSS